MEINAKQIFQGMPTFLNAEQQKMFSKLDVLKQDIENGSVFDYEDSILSGDRIAFVQTYYDEEKKQPHKYFGYNYETQDCTFCEYSAEGPEKQMMTYEANGHLRIEDFKNGLLYEEVDYKNNQLDGHVLQRYPNGQVKEDAYYKNGERDQYGYHGLECCDYNEQGVLIKKAQYTAGQLDGSCVEYYDNGQIKESASYILGQKDGFCATYDVDGKKTEIFYMDGKAMDNIPTDNELESITNSFSFDDLLSSFEKKSLSQTTTEHPKRSISETLSVLSDDVQVSVAKDAHSYQQDNHMGELLKGVDRVPPPVPQVGKAPQPPKIPAPDKPIMPPQVFLHGKGGR